MFYGNLSEKRIKNYLNLCKFFELTNIFYVEKCHAMICLIENLITFKMIYDKPNLVTILDLDDFFNDLKTSLFTQSVLSE